MSVGPLLRVLEATGYLAEGQPEPGVYLRDNIQRRGRNFRPDALWRSSSALTVYFKFEELPPSDELVSRWRREIWNEGFTPLLWVVSPGRVDLYNGFGRPVDKDDATVYLLETFQNIESELEKLDAFAGRLAMETGQFWTRASGIDRKTGVDHQLLNDLGHLERDLVAADLDRSAAQALIGRAVFTQYLIDRRIVDSDRLRLLCGYPSLPPILRDGSATELLFTWLSETFNGDMFPPPTANEALDAVHLKRVADFLEAVDPETGQTTLFPYQFDVIPVELISSIYEQFAHASASASAPGDKSKEGDVYYTRLPVVSLVLDEVMDGLTGSESVLDLTCGSGVFLVEALRRLVFLRSNREQPNRDLIRSILYNQIYGVDISEAAIRVAAFSLYLAALELDPNPEPPQALKFQPLIGKTLIVGDARTVEATPAGALSLITPTGLKKFDVIVGNPPWSFKGRAATAERRRHSEANSPAQPRGEGLDFVLRAIQFAHEETRFGIVLSAMPFFSGSKTGAAASRHVVQRLSPVTLVNLSNLTDWLFPVASMPGIALFARHRPQPADQMTVVQVPWSPAGPKTHTFEIAPSDIVKLPLAEWERQPVRLKTAAFGRNRDLLLLEALTSAHEGLSRRLSAVGAELRDGLILGTPKNQVRDANSLRELEILGSKDLDPFHVPEHLPRFGNDRAQWPRTRDTYRAPLLLVKEFLRKPGRAVAAVSERDLVFTDAYYGAALPLEQRDGAHLLAAILNSALASWFFLMTASEFGVWKRRLFLQDVGLLPVPDIGQAVISKAGRRILELAEIFRQSIPRNIDWSVLDEAVFDLYELGEEDRIVVRDGLLRAGWAWMPERIASVQAADTEKDLSTYARTFLSVIEGWLSARKLRHMRAEVFDLPKGDALRVVRFILEDTVGCSKVEVVRPDGELGDLLTRVGQRLNVRLASSIIGRRELRVHGRSEVVIIKPAARRHWMGLAALEDADAVIAESVHRATV
jgi:hypothetical protein